MHNPKSWLQQETEGVAFPLSPGLREEWSAWDFGEAFGKPYIYYRIRFGNEKVGFRTYGLCAPLDKLDQMKALIVSGKLLDMEDEYFFPTLGETESNFQ